MDDVAVKIDNVAKDFRFETARASTLKSVFTGLVQRKGATEKKTQHALRGVSFEIKKGEFFGIVGRNGSGKSTLLKILAGIYQPTKGNVKIDGRVVPFIELGVGFNPELTGRENVFLNGALLGFSKKEIDGFYDEVVAFAELEQFMDKKLKNYSSGMQVRLAFSIAIRAKADILLIDEVLAVGDEAFQRKCYQYFAEIRRQKQTVVLVTHDMDTIQEFCTRAALIDKGHRTVIDKPMKIAQIYHELNNQDGVTVNKSKEKSKTSTKYISAKMGYAKEGDRLNFDISLTPKVALDDPIVAMGIYRDTGEPVYRWASDENLPFSLDMQKHRKIRIEVTDLFPSGFFTASLFVKKRDRTKDYAVFNDIVKFEIKNLTPHKYAVLWKIPERTLINGKEVEDVHRR